ncbi:MAG: choice-of-anchor Q domain-containing protein [Actinomycetota bacterium]
MRAGSWRGRLLATAVAAIGAILAPTAPASADIVTVNCPTQDLQQRINAAAPGSTLLISGLCDENFTIDKNLTLKGNPTATLDGNFAGSVLTITQGAVHLVDLTITDGFTIPSGGSLSEGHGGGIYNTSGGALTLTRVSVTGNMAVGGHAQGSVGGGGGIYSRPGSVTLTDSSVTDNLAYASEADSTLTSAAGGGIAVGGGALKLVRSVILSNRAVVRFTQGTGGANGGGIAHAGDSTLTLIDSRVEGNRAAASGPDAIVSGGGISSSSAEFIAPGLSMTASRVIGNAAVANGTGTVSATGGGIDGSNTSIEIADSPISANRVRAESSDAKAVAIGGGIALGVTPMKLVRSRVTGSVVTALGTEAHAEGGAIGVTETSSTLRPSSIEATSSSLSANSVRAQAGFGGSFAQGGGISQRNPEASTEVDRSTFDANDVVASGIATTATGGGIDTAGPLTVLRSTLSRNAVQSFGFLGAGGSGGGLEVRGSNDVVRNSTLSSNGVTAASDNGTATATGGGVEVASPTGSLTLSFGTVVRNSSGATGKNPGAQGGGVHAAHVGTTLRATILALNVAPAGKNCSGSAIGSGGANVLGAVAGCTFQNTNSDKVGVANPKLGLLSANGGPTKTVPLLTGSPALDLIAAASCEVSTDQRGVGRPQNHRCDSGAYERKP